MTDINTPEAMAPPEVAPEDHPNVVAAAAVDEAQRASDVADAAHVQVTVDGTHQVSTSLLHSDSTYVEFFENGVHRIEQIISTRR